jgi:hypothetical protein
MKHNLYRTTDPDRPKSICDRNGEVVLALCKICGGAEACLPTNCPGRKLTQEEMNKVSNGELNF